jgi:hypothetical protein
MWGKLGGGAGDSPALARLGPCRDFGGQGTLVYKTYIFRRYV